MIIIRISGGIGNQLFQYAMGRALSLQNDGFDNAGGKMPTSSLKLDIHFYGLGIEPDRSFKLTHFNIPGISDIIATPTDFKKAGIPDPSRQDICSKMRRALLRQSESRKPLAERKIILEPKFGFCPEITGVKGDHYLSGVWQSEKYFAGYAEQIRKDLELSAPLSKAAGEMAEKIDSAGAGSISMHIRRGDQVKDPKLLKKHGDLDIDYYGRAVGYISGKIAMKASPHLFIFSDDIEWCKQNVMLNDSAGSPLTTTYVSAANIPDYEELVLMSICKNNIIAKSSFSWWGAWLNRNPDKIVVVPKQRFGSETGEPDDLIPTSWIKL